MTIQQAIERADELRAGNASSDESKIRWLTELDNNIINDIINKHIRFKKKEFVEYKLDDAQTELVVGKPYEDMYIYWLMTKIDMQAQETDKYNISLMMFNDVYSRYRAEYRRTHKTLITPEIRVGGRF